MFNLFRRLLLLPFLVLSWGSINVAAATETFFDQSLGDFQSELVSARKSGKRGVLLMFETEGCPFCRKMREQVLGQPEVLRFFRGHFAIFSVDLLGSVTVTDFAGQNMTEKNFARAQRVRGTPTFIFVGLDGKEMARFVGATRDAGEFLALGRYVADGYWRTRNFKQFFPDTEPESRKP